MRDFLVMSDDLSLLDDAFDFVDLPIEDKQFYSRLYAFFSKESKKKYKKRSYLYRLLTEEFLEASRLIDQMKVQESCTYRNIVRSRKLAEKLIDEKGQLDLEALRKSVEILTDHLYTLGPDRQHDFCRQEHILKVLTLLEGSKDLRSLLHKVSLPYSHEVAQSIIRDTLDIQEKVRLKDVHARRAVLAACLTYLRQNVGSCFATAPAIIVHGEQLSLFLEDMIEMLATGSIKRTFGGVEHSVPMSSSWGVGDLHKPFVLKKKLFSEGSFSFLMAFQASGLIKAKTKKKEAQALVQKLIDLAFGLENSFYSSFVVTPEEVFEKVLLFHNGLSKEGLQEYTRQQKGESFSGLMSQPIRSSKSFQSKGSYKNFQEQFQKAKRAFKLLSENALLKTWEFTLASFAETKAIFSRWNLYSSLGLAPNEEGGIGSCLFHELKKRLEKENDRVQEMSEQYEGLFQRVKYQESRIQRASSEDEERNLRIEYQTLVSEMNFFLEQRDLAHQRAHRWAEMFDPLIDVYDEKFREYFQEIYDANMRDISKDPYDDSPAGFRLVYKHGRSATSTWTPIYDEVQFIDFLAEFFHTTEREIVSLPLLEGVEKDFGEIISEVVRHVRTREFLETSLFRMAAARGGKIVENPLENLEKVDKKPWVYTSGGTMNHLVSCYYCREDLPQTEERWVESPTELLAFFIDVLKNGPVNVQKHFSDNLGGFMLAHSPTHAFVLTPGKSLFREAWEDREYTYTWIRENLVIPRQHFIKNIDLNELMMRELVQEMSLSLDEPYASAFKEALSYLSGIKSVGDFRKELVAAASTERSLQFQGEPVFQSADFDSFLYEMLPMTSGHEVEGLIGEVIGYISGLTQQDKDFMKKIMNEKSKTLNRYKVLSAKLFRQLLMSLVLLAKKTVLFSESMHSNVLDAMRKCGLAFPEPVIVADTNWVCDYFAFLVNPGTSELEFWRVDALGAKGAPMARWKCWLDGSNKKPTWGIYNQVSEYGI